MTSTVPASSSASAFDVVAFGAHPDDVELCCGGLVAKLVALGHRVAIVDLTRGEMATRGTVEERALEAEAAARELGVQHRENLGLPDGGLRDGAAGEGAAHVDVVALALRRLRPELVLAPWAVERHPDHEATHAIVRRALFLAGLARWSPLEALDAPGAPHRPRVALWYPMRHLARASFIVDVTAHHVAKMRAVRAHASQVAPPAAPSQVGAPAPPATPATLVSSPLSLSSLAARDAFYGAQIGVAFGEPFIVDEAVAIDDPLAHFRGRPPALFFPERERA